MKKCIFKVHLTHIVLTLAILAAAQNRSYANTSAPEGSCLSLLEPEKHTAFAAHRALLQSLDIKRNLKISEWRKNYDQAIQASNYAEAQNLYTQLSAMILRELRYLLEDAQPILIQTAIGSLIDTRAEEAVQELDAELRTTAQLSLAVLAEALGNYNEQIKVDTTHPRLASTRKADVLRVENQIRTALHYLRPIRAMALGNAFRALVEPELENQKNTPTPQHQDFFKKLEHINEVVLANLKRLASPELSERETAVYSLGALEHYLKTTLSSDVVDSTLKNAEYLEREISNHYVNQSPRWSAWVKIQNPFALSAMMKGRQEGFKLLPIEGPYSERRVRAEKLVASLAQDPLNWNSVIPTLQSFTEPALIREVLYPLLNLLKNAKNTKALRPLANRDLFTLHLKHTLQLYKHTLWETYGDSARSPEERGLAKTLLNELDNIQSEIK